MSDATTNETETASNTETTTANGETGAPERNGPDYIAMQYREIRTQDGWKTRKERIGAAFRKEFGAICFRPAGQQIIEGDIYLFPVENGPE